MHVLFWVLRYYPFWALPLALVAAELAWYYRRKKSKTQRYFWSIASFFVLSAIAWVGFQGWSRSDEWIKMLLQRR